MVILKLMGGLGNQMFQIAAGCNLARRLNAQLSVDFSDFEHFRKRQFALEAFCVDGLYHEGRLEDLAEDAFVKKRLKWQWFDSRKMDRYFYFREKQFHYDDFFSKVKGNVVLVGHWNSEQYFAEIKNDVFNMFQLKTECQDNLDRQLVSRMKSGPSVSIHVRRGDYVSDAGAAKVHGFVGLEYYRKAVAEIRKRVVSPDFYVFSDDKRWVKDNFSFLGDYQIVDEEDQHKDFEDLALMSTCRHNIIANSTFSWWGGYLNPDPDKIVIAPKPWFRDKSKDTRDLYVDGWTVIQAEL